MQYLMKWYYTALDYVCKQRLANHGTVLQSLSQCYYGSIKISELMVLFHTRNAFQRHTSQNIEPSHLSLLDVHCIHLGDLLLRCIQINQ